MASVFGATAICWPGDGVAINMPSHKVVEGHVILPLATTLELSSSPLTVSYNWPYLYGKGGQVMIAYNPDKFGSLYEAELGQRLWAFLTEEANIARLETASSHLGKPAVEGIEEHFLETFHEDVLADRVKQLVGHMVRQILEQRDWVLDLTDVKVQSVPLSKAARYRRPDRITSWITFHAFRNTSDPHDVVITDRHQNAPLPADARWAYYSTFFVSPLKASVALGVCDIRQFRQHVHAHGYQRMRIEQMLRCA